MGAVRRDELGFCSHKHRLRERRGIERAGKSSGKAG